MILYSLLLSGWLWSITRSQFNLYNTEKILDIGNFQTTCFHYYNYHTLSITEKTEYCLSQSNDDEAWVETFPNTTHGNFTFDQLYRMSVTTKDLLHWSASIDLAERYQDYLDQANYSFVSKEIFFNCTKPWFGPYCQYSFGLETTYTFQDIVRKTFRKKFFSSSSDIATYLSCYMHLKCNRGSSHLCLDWREICDGRIDCIDGGADEEDCFDLEMNECDENEYRCHNGLCISKEFVEDELPQCLDASDISNPVSYPGSGEYPIIFEFEERFCSTIDKQFKCGDGRCVTDYGTCLNKRHVYLYESVSRQGNLSYTCWIAMVCLTKILNQINETSCQQIFRSSNITLYLQSCDVITQFPIVPVLFGHVRFLYILNSVNTVNTDRVLVPDYICYDQDLCNFPISISPHGFYACQPSREMNLNLEIKLKTWSSLIGIIEPYFRKCSTQHHKKNDSHTSSLYCCKNSTKCISFHRILDGISDCYLNDDEEEFERSCLIDDVLRFKCGNENKCYSVTVPRQICPHRHLINFKDMNFHQICDRHIQISPLLIDGQNHTDETECNQWPCNNIYTRCDGFWSCPRGEDEENCTTKQICPSSSFACVSPYNYTLICLSANRVNDEHIDCLGAADELRHCRSDLSNIYWYNGYRCWNDSKCIGRSDLCDRTTDCLYGDDETFCRDHLEPCFACDYVECPDVKEAICRIGILDRPILSLGAFSIHQPFRNRMTEPMLQSHMKYITTEPSDRTWPWRCHHGLYVILWSSKHSSEFKCFCPSFSYGDLCQYQNQRISFTAKVNVINRYGIYALIVMLIKDDEDHQEINSYHQFVSITARECERLYNTYLTYSTRPKNNSKRYSVRVDAFDKTRLIYLASWHFDMRFSFLPNYRMAVVLNIPDHKPSSFTRCPLKCQNGECMKYINKETIFCRCHPGWSGVRCNIPVRCSDCSLNSLCIGRIYNRSICVCPTHKGGPRCLLTLSCSENYCENNSTCLVHSDGMNEMGFVCICPEKFMGSSCHIDRPKLEISLHRIQVFSSYLFIYLYTNAKNPSKFEQIELTIIPQKLKTFQRTVSIYTKGSISMVFVKIDNSYYMTLPERSNETYVSTLVDPIQRCAPSSEVLKLPFIGLPKIRRIKYYHVICQTHHHLTCFFDESYMCLCTREHHANCFTFNQTSSVCRHITHCQNGAQCLNDGSPCPIATWCNCTDCYFGDRCQFYAKGIGLTLDDILRYDIRPNRTISEQTILIKLCAAFTIIMLVAGFINSALSIVTFSGRKSREVGSGIYLLTSSIVSLLTVSIFTVKFWFLILTQMNSLTNDFILRRGCQSLEFMLKVCLYTNNWLGACVTLERSITVQVGVHFNKRSSKRIAQWIILFLPLLVIISIIHESIYRDLFEDKDEQRFWCVIPYTFSIHTYNTIISLFHFLGPFFANFYSATFITFRGTRQRAQVQPHLTQRQHQWQQFNDNKHLLISSIILVILSIPRLIISSLSGCVKASYQSQIYAAGYFISFVPSVSIFIVFVLPSNFYRNQFKTSIKSWRQSILRRLY
ncbi:hypothetical protein I4U23_003577 [Adineta vaga]|nr:hypothetical protein I4U23_003577 [Adineta vaga]